MKTIKNDIGNMVKKIIKARGLKLAHVADTANISLSHLNKIISGEKNPSIEVIRSLAKALAVKESELLGEEQASFIEQKIGDLTKSEFEKFYLGLRFKGQLYEIASKLSEKDFKKLLAFAKALDTSK